MKAQQRARAAPIQLDSVPTGQQESIMVVDCGSLTTKVVLLDGVEGQHRFVAHAQAPGTGGAPWEDITVGVIDAIREMERTTGRRFLDEEDHLITPEAVNGSGVDRFLAVSSAAEPLRVVLAGLVRDVSLDSARRAALSTYAQIVDVISVERSVTGSGLSTLDEQINAIWNGAPDVVCMVGGTDGGAEAPVMDMVQNVLRVALYLMEGNAPSVVYAGNVRLREAIVQQLGEVTAVQTVDNVRPLSGVENIGPAHEELEVLFFEQKMSALPGINALRSWSPEIILPTARAADYTIRFCERAWRTGKTALGVDIGGSSVTINACRDGQTVTTIRTDLGIGPGMANLLEWVDVQDIARWLPYEIEPAEVQDFLLNKALRPRSVPQTRRDLLLEQAAAREMLRLALRDSLPGWPRPAGNEVHEWPGDWDGDTSGLDGGLCIPPCAPLIASGSLLARAPYQGHSALLLLDALQPTGVSDMYLDEYNLIASLGTVANINPLAAVQALRNDGLTYLGTAVVPIGHARPGDKVLTVRPADKQSSMSSDVTYGSLEAIPFQFFEPGTMLELVPSRGFDVGSGPGKSLKVEYRGGSVGLIIDARGRPLQLAEDPTLRRQTVDHWLWEMMSA